MKKKLFFVRALLAPDAEGYWSDVFLCQEDDLEKMIEPRYNQAKGKFPNLGECETFADGALGVTIKVQGKNTLIYNRGHLVLTVPQTPIVSLPKKPLSDNPVYVRANVETQETN